MSSLRVSSSRPHVPDACRTLTFQTVAKGPRDSMFDLKKAADGDKSPLKVDLGAGVYRDEVGAYYEFPAVKEAKKRLVELHLGHDYNPTTGIASFTKAATGVIFGGLTDTVSDKLASVQTVAGTGANRIGAIFLNKHWPTTNAAALKAPQPNATKVFIGVPAWGNYEPLFRHAGFANIETYRHLDQGSGELDFDSVVTALKTATERSIFVFQACCHNPIGRDFTRDQWTRVADLMSHGRHFAFFDAAYQGLGDSFEADAWAVRYFAERGIDMLVCQSFSKNMGLYSERVGVLHVLCKTTQIADNVFDQIRSLVRWEFSSAPAYGSRLVDIILNDPVLCRQWTGEVEAAKKRIEHVRQGLYHRLTHTYQTPSPYEVTSGNKIARPWVHLLEEKGLFSYTGLSADMTKMLVQDWQIYLPENGRINVTGLNDGNMDRVARAFDSVVRTQVR
ncbi:hypothetical protein ACHAPT_001343 [Fusarium lateritium]